MKKLLLLVMVAALSVSACSSNKTNTKNNKQTADKRTTVSAKDAKYQIIDQEFDNLLAPDADYDTLPAYELQACGDNYLPPADLKGVTKPAAKKTGKKVAAKKTSTTNTNTTNTTNKKVINNTNIYYLDGNDPIPATTRTTTTTYTSNEVAPDTL